MGRNSAHGQAQTACGPINQRISAACRAMEYRMHQPRTGALQQRMRHRLDRPIEMPTTGCDHHKGLSQL
jgi:hypothetical protein